LKEIPEDSRAGRELAGVRTLKNPEVLKNLPTIRALNAIAKKRGQPLAEMALAWVLRLPMVTSAVIGASSIPQLESNVKTLSRLTFSKEELVEIREILRSARTFVKLPGRKRDNGRKEKPAPPRVEKGYRQVHIPGGK